MFTAKNEFIDEQAGRLAISDHWRLREPDPLALGLAQAMGWTKYLAPGALRVTVPALTLDALVGDVKTKLHASGGIRVVGDAKTSVRRSGCCPDRRRSRRR